MVGIETLAPWVIESPWTSQRLPAAPGNWRYL
jgi:hypothetical protein